MSSIGTPQQVDKPTKPTAVTDTPRHPHQLAQWRCQANPTQPNCTRTVLAGWLHERGHWSARGNATQSPTLGCWATLSSLCTENSSRQQGTRARRHATTCDMRPTKRRSAAGKSDGPFLLFLGPRHFAPPSTSDRLPRAISSQSVANHSSTTGV